MYCIDMYASQKNAEPRNRTVVKAFESEHYHTHKQYTFYLVLDVQGKVRNFAYEQVVTRLWVAAAQACMEKHSSPKLIDIRWYIIRQSF